MKIPERTVDSMVAIEVTRLDPSAIITSPTNTKGSVDHLIRQRLAITVLECKGVDDRERIPIRLPQLHEYVFGSGPRGVTYLIPSRPPGRAWVRTCSEACCGGVGCRFCPRDGRSWTGLEPWVRRLAYVDRMQPWFAHWSWCVDAATLAAEVGISARSAPAGNKYFAWDDDTLAALPGAQRLCHWFGLPAGAAYWSQAITAALEREYGEDSFADLDGADEDGTPPLVILQPSTGENQ